MLRPMLRTSGASMFGLQLGQGLGQLATEVVGATDIGLPLSEPGHVALLPTNVKSVRRGSRTVRPVTSRCTWRCGSAPGSGCSPPRAGCGSRCWPWSSSMRAASRSTPPLSEQAVGQLDPSNLTELSQTLEGGGCSSRRRRRRRRRSWSGSRPCWRWSKAGWTRWSPRPPRTGCRPAVPWPRPYAGPGRVADRRRRPSRPWSASSCARGGCGTRPTSGLRCATPAGSTAGMPCGRIRTWCRPRPTWTIRSASSRRSARRPALTRNSTQRWPSCWTPRRTEGRAMDPRS